MEVSQLLVLGFTQSEAKVYLALLQRGKLKASEIVAYTQVASSKIYELLDSLERKGFIQVIPDKVNHYVAKSFEYVTEIIESKKKELGNLQKQLKEFEVLSKKRRDDKDILVVRGKKNFHRIIVEMRSFKKTFSYGIKWKADVTDRNIMKAVLTNVRRGVSSKTLYDYNVSKDNVKKWEKIKPDYKFIKSEGVAMDISDEGVMILILELGSTILIKSRTFAEVMKQLFEGYYENKK